MSIMEMLLPDTAGGMVVLLMTVLGGFLLCYLLIQQPPTPESSEEPTQEPPEPPRNFTIEQLHEFDGANDATPAYVALRGEVFDVSSKPEHYKKGGGYNLFSGHDASYSLATGSLNPADLDKSYAGLSSMERDTLDGWVERFKHVNGYPVVGKVVDPPKPKDYTLGELRQFDGTTPVPDGSASPPILVGVMGKVYDMSYGGVNMYGPGRSYNLFAGRDASVALAKMSFDPANLDNPDASKLSSQDMQVLEDWDNKFAKKYPVVGKIVTETGANTERSAGVDADADTDADADGAPEETPGSGAQANAQLRKDDAADAEGTAATDNVRGMTNAGVCGQTGPDGEADAVVVTESADNTAGAVDGEAVKDETEVEDAAVDHVDAVAHANDKGVEKELGAETEACPDPKSDGESVKIPDNGGAGLDDKESNSKDAAVDEVADALSNGTSWA